MESHLFWLTDEGYPQRPPGNIEGFLRFGVFLDKTQISEALFQPLITGIMQGNKLRKELRASQLERTRIETVRKLVDTLKHEINNPLGAVLGGAFLMENAEDSTSRQKKAAQLVEKSGKRIQKVLEELSKTVELESVKKASLDVFHIPGDDEWEE